MSAAIYMDAEIKPNRSLSERGFVVLISVITVANVASAIVFLKIGAHLVPIFLGIDVAAITIAFLASFKAGRIIERVRISALDVVITHETPTASRIVWESRTAATRVSTERDEENRVMSLKIQQSDRQAPVAAALSPTERGEFARALEAALWRARRSAI